MDISPDFKPLFKPGTNVLRRQALSLADKEVQHLLGDCHVVCAAGRAPWDIRNGIWTLTGKII